jgi:predicted patatin/cPLA2 family phospholipase
VVKAVRARVDGPRAKAARDGAFEERGIRIFPAFVRGAYRDEVCTLARQDGGWMRGTRMTSQGEIAGRSAAGALVAADPASLLLAPEEAADPVLRILLDRARAGSRPLARSDPHQVCLAIEGGGMRGAVSAGMCVVLEAAGLISAFDRIYGVSAGALNGWATAAGQARLGVTYYHDAVSYGVVNRMRPLVRRPVIDFDLLFEELIAIRKPLSSDDLRGAPELRALATSLDSYSLRVLADFSDLDELRQAVRASAALPRLGGEPPLFRGERMADGGLIEPIPFHTAIEEGATHVLVLRSRPAAYRKPALSELGQLLALRDDPRLVELLKGRGGVYNRQAGELEQGSAGREHGAQVLQIAVAAHERLIGRLESNTERATEAVRSGAQAMASAILRDPIDLCWQPVIYRTTPGPASSPPVDRATQAIPSATSAARVPA